MSRVRFRPGNSTDGFTHVLIDSAAEWTTVLARDAVETRADEERWSDLEYGCHVRDVFRVMDGRLASMLSEDDPLFQNWDQDETAVDERYSEQDPALVNAQLLIAADQFAQRVARIQPDEWSRPGTRSNGSRFTRGDAGSLRAPRSLHHRWDVDAPSAQSPSHWRSSSSSASRPSGPSASA